MIDVAHEACPCCGGSMHCIGELRTEQLDIVPAQLRVRVTRRPRYACRACEGAVVVAEAPARPIDGGMPTEALIAHVVVSKFCDSLPLYRQSQMLAAPGHHAGSLDAEQLGGHAPAGGWRRSMIWWLRRCCPRRRSLPTTPACRCSIPAAGGPRRAFSGAMRSMTVPGADRPIRPWPTSMPRIARTCAPPSIWPRFNGVLQVDGYDGFKRLAGDRVDQSVRLAFCWAHMRRAFFQFHASTKSPLAAEVLTRVAALYAIEAEIRGHPAEQRRRSDRSEVDRSSRRCMVILPFFVGARSRSTRPWPAAVLG